MYEKYKKIRTREEFYDTWEDEDLNQLNEILKDRIYDKYLLKCSILQRDSFKCQNINCEFPDSKLTIHHVKHRRNGGEDKVRNLVTVCNACHKRFNRRKAGLTFSNEDNVPPHIRGHTFNLNKPEPTIDWKQVRVDMKIVRKKLKNSGVEFSIKDFRIIMILMRFLSKPYYELEYDIEHSDDDI